MIPMTEAFVYYWKDTLTDMFYIGSHKGDIEDGYICSSEPMLEEYKERSEDFDRKILFVGPIDKVRQVETELLQRYDAKNNLMFYNLHNGDKDFFNDIPWNKGLTKENNETMAHVSKKLKGITYRSGFTVSEKTKTKMSEAAFKKWNKITDRTKGPMSEEHKENVKKSNVKTWTNDKELLEKHSKIMKEIASRRQKVACPHCNKKGDSNLMKRWHFNNCKDKVNG